MPIFSLTVPNGRISYNLDYHMDITTRMLTTFQLWNKKFMEATVTRLEKESITFGIYLICQLFHDPFPMTMYPTILTTTWTLQPEC